MSGVRTRTAAAILIVVGILTLSGTTIASSQQRARAKAELAPITLSKPLPEVPGVRFFTISEVLRRRDGFASTAGTSTPVRIASIDGAQLRGSLNDASPLGYPMVPKVGPFGTSTFRAPEGPLWVKWRKLEADMRKDDSVIAECRGNSNKCPSPEARRVAAIVKAVEVHDGRRKLEEVNRAVNSSIQYTSDLVQHGVPDLWSSALATFGTGRGDCEDYAAAKYAILLAAGVPAEDLRIMLVNDLTAREAHAVLAVQINGTWLILDNRRADILDDRAISYFVPLFALNQQGVSLLARSYVSSNPAQDIATSAALVSQDMAQVIPEASLLSHSAEAIVDGTAF